MAEARRAWDVLLRRHVAVKLFQPHSDPGADRRFDDEVRALAGLCHPGLVSVYDADTHDGTPFVVLQLVEGRTLRERIAQAPLPLDQVRHLGAGLADALEHVHSHHLVHREVNPSNILLDSEDNPYLTDFGLSRLTGATKPARTDQLVDAASYLAPEQVQGEEVGHQADVYALGLVLLECLTGRREYQGGDVEAAIARLHRPPAVPEGLPTDVERLLSRMTALAPHDRPTAHDCAQVLRVPTFRPGGAASPARDKAAGAATTKVTPRPEPRPTWKTLVASAGAMVGAFAITVAATSGQQPAASGPTSPATSGSSAQPVASTTQTSSDAPQDRARPQLIIGSPRPTVTPEVTTSAATPPSTAQPATESKPETTTAPVVTTTTEPQPSTSVTPTSEPSTTSPEPSEPTAPTEDAGKP
ncbi:serine/threonine protein kinase [Saccharothrix tamanrassetensis]|uniref:non-specific serine/threonine protein kinase n=2 Tax=Saccharothrix tamanrassetensis TaxID=1051531 RepID=A0A841CKX7_9PSEU|nr:serine/threonine protein kinase [Saccharothrix tamanrassetensis]